MEIKGNGFRYFINDKEVRYKDLQTMIRLDMTVQIDGLNVYYSSPKKENKTATQQIKEKQEKYYSNKLTVNIFNGDIKPVTFYNSFNTIKEVMDYLDCITYTSYTIFNGDKKISWGTNHKQINMNRLIEEELERQQVVSSSPKRRAVLTFNYPANLTNNYYPHDGSKEGIKAAKQKITEELERQEQQVFKDWDSRIDNIIGAFTEAEKRGGTIRRKPSLTVGIEEITKIMTEGKKENSGKTDYSEIDFDILDLMANRFNANKHKYPQGNMLKPIEEKQLLFALLRHLKKMIQPIDNDPETFEEHLASILCNAQMVYQQRKLNKN